MIIKYAVVILLHITLTNCEKCGIKLHRVQGVMLQDNVPILVNVSISFINIDISSDLMHLHSTAMLSQRWKDATLGPNELTKNRALLGRVWRPVIVVVNNIATTSLKGSADQDTLFWRGVEEDILYIDRVSSTTKCTTSFMNFPFDKQICAVKLGTFRFTEEEITLLWNHEPVNMQNHEHLGEFITVGYKTKEVIETRLSGNFTNLVLEISVKRNYQHYLACLVIPSMAVVMVSQLLALWGKLRLNLATQHFTCLAVLGLLVQLHQKAACSLYGDDNFKVVDLFYIICALYTLISTLLAENEENEETESNDQEEFNFNINNIIRRSNKRQDYLRKLRKKKLLRFGCFLVFLIFCVLYITVGVLV